ncbi:MAG: BatA domain-containing protein [Phycisphaerales bacterium]
MTLLSPLALLFGLIAAVPLILHLHQNRKRTVMLFSTNRFFTDAIVRTQRRLKLRRWLLLVLRMAACLLLALALSQPILAWSLLSNPQGRRDLLILLDDSLSMSCSSNPQSEIPNPTFAHARQIALAAIDHLVTGDRAAVLTTTGQIIADPSGTSPSTDLLDLRAKLSALQPAASAGDIPNALRIAASFFNDDRTGRSRATLILTDNQTTDWRSGQWPALPLGCTTQIISLGDPPTANVTADLLSLATPGNTAVVGQPNALTVRIVNHDLQRRRAQLHLLINDRLQADQPLDLPGQSASEHTFPITFTQPGEHRIQLQLLMPRDALPADDSLYAVVNVQSQLPVLIVHGPPSANTRTGAFYLTAALQSVTSGGDDETTSGGVKVQSITADQLTPAQLAAFTSGGGGRVVFLCDVERLSPAATTALRHFVRQGGGLAVFPGSHIDIHWYNTQLADLLPARIGLPLSIPDHPLPIVQADVTHPLLSRFSDDLRAAISGINITHARHLIPHDAWIIAQLEGDHPFILQRTISTPRQSDNAALGSSSVGNVVLLAADPEPQSTNLPLRRLFIPFVHRLASYLAYSNNTTPLAYTGNQPGFHTRDSLTIAVNAPRSESDPTAITSINPDTSGDAASDWHILGVTRFSGSGSEHSPDLAPILDASRSGRGYWHSLLYLALFITLLEPLIANYTRRQRGVPASAGMSSPKEAA